MRPKSVTKSNNGYLEAAPMRGPNDPTAYEEAAAVLDQKALDKWVRSHYLSKYVPEAVLERLGLAPWAS